jgi:RHS repeat-associated protein
MENQTTIFNSIFPKLEKYGYKRGFNGKEMLDEMEGDGNAYDFGARMYIARLGRWMSCDSKESKYPGISTYNFSLNNPIIFNDPDGNDARYTVVKNENGGGTITIESTIHLYGKDASIELADKMNTSFSDLNNMATYTDPTTKEQWNVIININFVYDENIKSETDVLNLPKGDNIMKIDKSLTPEQLGTPNDVNAQGTVPYPGANTGRCKNNLFAVIIHEAGHQIGFDERYNRNRSYATVVGDIMGAYFGSDPTRIAPIHFDDIARTILILSENGKYFKTGAFSLGLDKPGYNPRDIKLGESKKYGESENIKDIRKSENNTIELKNQ